jgi:O-antigen ligase
MNVATISRGLWSWVVVGAIAFLTVVVLVVAATKGAKVMVVVLGGGVTVIGALVSGNPRLFFLYGLMLTIPFDLSKRIGGYIEKMGGETSFRIEMSDPFLLALAAFLVRDFVQGYRTGLRVPKACIYWGIIILIGAWGVAFGPWRTTAAHEVVRMIKVLLLFLVVANELQRPGRVLHAVVALTLAMLVQSGVGLLQYVTKGHLGLELLGETGAGTIDQLKADSVATEQVFRAGAFLSHPNLFGVFLASLLPFPIACFLIRTDRTRQAFFFVAIGVGFAALITSLSRSGWVSFFVAFIVLVLSLAVHERMRRQSILTMAGAGIALGVVCVVFAGPIMTRIFESKESAMLSRAEYISDAMGMISAKPITGWGLNSYVYAAPPFTRYGARVAHERYEQWLPPVHNIYLLWWAETGIIGLAVHLALLGSIVKRAIGNLSVRNELMFAVNAACLAGMAAFLVDGIFSFSLRLNAILRVFFVMAGIILAIHYWRLKYERGPAPAAAPVRGHAPEDAAGDLALS